MAARIGAAARAARTDAGLELLDIARAASVSEATVSRFEIGHGWRRETDRIVAAYAVELGTTPETLWRAALDRDE
jgi:transcriptional regulator with XRE-family HTH domain